ncbi:MAG TPA: hypothetical protein VI072_21765 [Polyangiaceae bacterium]
MGISYLQPAETFVRAPANGPCSPLAWLALGATLFACGPAPIGGAAGSGGTGGSAGTAGSGGASVGPQFKPPDCEQTHSFYAHGGVGEADTTPFPIPLRPDNGGNAYQCFYFDPPYPADSQGLWFYPDLSRADKRFIHHMILYGTETRKHVSGTSERCSGIQVGAYFVAGWAPGSGETQFPSDVGVLLPNAATGQYILEVHYGNPNNIADAVDSTGMQFCTARPDARPHTASTHFTGTEAICVPPGGEFTAQGPCDPRDDLGDIHVIGWSPHAHLLADRVTTKIMRANGSVEVMHDEPYSFNNQRPYGAPGGEIIIRAGDTIETSCHYRNPTAFEVPFGEKTQDEMCYNFVLAWPANALSIDPATLGDWEREALLGQQERRCVKPLSIFGSCNGADDMPK